MVLWETLVYPCAREGGGGGGGGDVGLGEGSRRGGGVLLQHQVSGPSARPASGTCLQPPSPTPSQPIPVLRNRGTSSGSDV